MMKSKALYCPKCGYRYMENALWREGGRCNDLSIPMERGSNRPCDGVLVAEPGGARGSEP